MFVRTGGAFEPPEPPKPPKTTQTQTQLMHLLLSVYSSTLMSPALKASCVFDIRGKWKCAFPFQSHCRLCRFFSSETKINYVLIALVKGI